MDSELNLQPRGGRALRLGQYHQRVASSGGLAPAPCEYVLSFRGSTPPSVAGNATKRWDGQVNTTHDLFARPLRSVNLTEVNMRDHCGLRAPYAAVLTVASQLRGSAAYLRLEHDRSGEGPLEPNGAWCPVVELKVRPNSDTRVPARALAPSLVRAIDHFHGRVRSQNASRLADDPVGRSLQPERTRA
jgi:hypothetical protein